MIVNMLLKIALDMGARNGWVVPSYEELTSLDVDGVVEWMAEHNPEQAQIIKERFSILKEMM